MPTASPPKETATTTATAPTVDSSLSPEKEPARKRTKSVVPQKSPFSSTSSDGEEQQPTDTTLAKKVAACAAAFNDDEPRSPDSYAGLPNKAPDFGPSPEAHKWMINFNTKIIAPTHSVDADINEATVDFCNWAAANPVLYNTIEDTIKIKATSGNDPKYERDMARDVRMFFKVLKCHPAPQVQELATMIVDPLFRDKSRSIPRLVMLVRGIKTPPKKELLNTTITILVVNGSFINKDDPKKLIDRSKYTDQQIANMMYQPSSVKTRLKRIFSWLERQSVVYKQKEFKHMVGGYHGVFKRIIDWVLQVSPLSTLSSCTLSLTVPTHKSTVYLSISVPS